VGSRAILDAVVKGKTPRPCRAMETLEENIKINHINRMRGCGLGLHGGSCEYGNKIPGSINGGEFLD
jgi:hypothetical protein